MSYNPFCQQLYIFTIIRSLIIFSNKGVSSWYCNKRHATKNIFTFLENPQHASTSMFAKNETWNGIREKILNTLFTCRLTKDFNTEARISNIYIIIIMFQMLYICIIHWQINIERQFSAMWIRLELLLKWLWRTSKY